MPRTRYLKPDFFVDDKVSELQPLTRILFIGLWTLADREGKLELNLKKIKVQILPYDEFDIEKGLDELSNKNFIILYCIENKAFIKITNFLKHQKPHNTEKTSQIQEPTQNNRYITVKDTLNNGSLTKKKVVNYNYNLNSNFKYKDKGAEKSNSLKEEKSFVGENSPTSSLDNNKTNIDIEIDNHKKRYNSHIELINKAIDAFASTRKTYSISSNQILNILKKYEKYEVDRVVAGIQIYLNPEKNYPAEGKAEDYCLGIIRKNNNFKQTNNDSNFKETDFSSKGSKYEHIIQS